MPRSTRKTATQTSRVQAGEAEAPRPGTSGSRAGRPPAPVTWAGPAEATVDQAGEPAAADETAALAGESLTIDTPRGPATVRVTDPHGPARALLVLGHGAGGGVDAPDLVALQDTAVAAGVRVALVTQPYRVAGRRAPAPATHLDEAWTTVVRTLVVPRTPLILGGRSSGARIACRTAHPLAAAGVLALAFPLHPPGRPEKTRAAELPADIPTLVLNGDRDPFGIPTPTGLVEVITRPGATHDLRKDVTTTAALAVAWLRTHGWAT